MGHKVHVALNGEEAFETLKLVDVDMIFSDVMIPRMKGTELLKLVKKFFPDIKTFVFMTAFDQIEQEKATELGATAVILKPLTFKDLENFFDSE